MNLLTRWKLVRLGRTGAERSDHVAFSRDHKLLVGLRVADIVREFKVIRNPRMNCGRFRNCVVRGKREAF